MTVAPLDTPLTSASPVALDELPSMPAAAVTIVGRCDDPEVGIAELSDAISLDPALSARILRMANSAAYSRGNEITTLDRAMMLMGLKVVKLTALGFVVSSTLSDSLSSAADLESQVWRQCLVEAVACRELALLAGIRATSEAFLVGLFDGMGQLLGLLSRPEAFGTLLTEDPWPSFDAQRATLGMTVTELVRAALASWGVPQLYSLVLEAAERVDDVADHSEVGQLSGVLTLARHATRQLLGHAGADPTEADQVLTHLGLAPDAVDTIAITLGTHVTDLAETLDVDLGATLDYQALLAQARDQIIATSMQIAQESIANAAQIQQMSAQQDDLRREALTDRLTTLPNRACFDDALASAIDDRVSGRTVSGALGVAMIDIDHFKSFNDTHGHRCGDLVLAAVGEQLRAITRKGEMIARYGGEEFVLVAPIVDDLEALEKAAERIRSSIESLRVESDGLLLNVTVSVGAIAAATVTSAAAASSLVEAADRLLYQAKNAGRNAARVEALGFS
ncbi:MAG: diguanylate cyclase [Acidimicrobiales bacterium]